MSVNALKVSNLKKVYKNGTEALKGVNLSVADGDFFALLGPNGAGKSTLLGIVSSVVNKTEGNVEIYGHDLDKDSFNAKFFLGITPQEFNMNIFESAENVLISQAQYYGLPIKTAKERAEINLELLGLTEKKKVMVRELSGGMKRRLTIARAMMHNPKLLILDEPTAGVDIEIRHQMWQYLKKINEENVTIVLTTHYLEEAEQLCKNIAIIDKGTILVNTSIKDLLHSNSKKTFILDVENSEKLPKHAIKGITIRQKDSNSVEVQTDDNISLTTLFEALNEYGLIIKDIRNKTNRLEELFLNLTAR